MSEVFDDLLKWLREESHQYLTKAEICRASGLDMSALRYMHDRDWKPRISTIVSLARARDLWEKRRLGKKLSELEVN